MRAFKRANIWSIVPIMLLPRQVLMEFNGISERTATCITGALKQEGLGHHTFNEKMGDFIDEQFGSIENAPVSVLNVTLRDEVATRPYYDPLPLLRLIEKVNPRFTVGDLFVSSPQDLLIMVEEFVAFGPLLSLLKDDMPKIDLRLSRWDSDAIIGALADDSWLGHPSLV